MRFVPLILGILITSTSAAAELKLKVLRFEDLLAEQGSAVRCEYEAMRGFGYLITRTGEAASIEMISQGKLEGEKTRVEAEIKDYGTPLVLYLAHFKRYDAESGNYFEILIRKRMDGNGSYRGDVMFTDSYYVTEKNKDTGKEQEREILKPITKKKMICRPVAAE